MEGSAQEFHEQKDSTTKKQESYKKDRRNTYGEAGARSRFAIARRKRNRSSRARAASRQIAAAARGDPELAERLEGKAVARFGSGWSKSPDEPLEKVLVKKLKRRVQMGSMPEAVARKKRKRIGTRSKQR